MNNFIVFLFIFCIWVFIGRDADADADAEAVTSLSMLLNQPTNQPTGLHTTAEKHKSQRTSGHSDDCIRFVTYFLFCNSRHRNACDYKISPLFQHRRMTFLFYFILFLSLESIHCLHWLIIIITTMKHVCHYLVWLFIGGLTLIPLRIYDFRKYDFNGHLHIVLNISWAINVNI